MSKRTNSEIRRVARESLSGNWGNGVIATLLYWLITTAVNVILLFVPFGQIHFDTGGTTNILNFFAWLLFIPLQWGISIYFLHILRSGQPSIGQLFEGYKDFARIFFTELLIVIYTFLWSLLFIIPGIIKSLSYAMTPFILRDRPDLKYDSAVRESMRLMHGNKLKLFLLILSFIGWFILALLTLGLGLLLFVPYYRTSIAAFYEDLKNSDAETHSAEYITESPAAAVDTATVG